MKPERHGHEPDTSGPRDYTDADIRLKPIFLFVIFTAIFTAITFVGVLVTFNMFKRETEEMATPNSRFMKQRVLPPEPRLQVNERRSLDEQRAIEHAELTSYAWIDKSAGIVRIPVDRAIDLVAQKGLPARAAPIAK